MSKCGKCGFEGNIGEHTILRCRTKDIPKSIYDRMCVWMADEENLKGDVWLKEEAFDIMYELSKIYEGEECK